MKIIALLLVIIGAAVAYGAKKVLRLVLKKDEFTDEEVGITKIIGFIIVLIAAIFIFIF